MNGPVQERTYHARRAARHEPARVLAQRFGATEQTGCKWKRREVFCDRSHTAHRLPLQPVPAG